MFKSRLFCVMIVQSTVSGEGGSRFITWLDLGPSICFVLDVSFTAVTPLL